MTSPLPPEGERRRMWSPTAPTVARMWTPTAPKKITQEELNDFTERQMRFVQHKKSRIQALETQVYRGSGDLNLDRDRPLRPTINLENLEKSVARQHDQETQLRETRMRELQEKYAPQRPKSVTMDSEAVLDVARRMHEQATSCQLKRKKAMEEKQKSIEEEAKTIEKGKKMTKSDIRSMGDRLCQSKKELSYEEMNKRIFGKTVQLPEKYVSAARRIQEQEAELKKLAQSKKL